MKRRLKIQPVGDAYKNRIYPQLRIKGKWLAAAGFAPKQYAEIEVRPGQLIINALASPQPEPQK